MNKLTAAGLALALVSGSAFAADLPARKEAPVYVPPAPTFSWTGLYGGVNIGYGWSGGGYENGGLQYAPPAGATTYPTTANSVGWGGNNNINGVLGGGQVGYNYQFSPWLVVGVETDIQAADVNSKANFYGVGALGDYAAVSSASYVDWFGTLRGRVGLMLPSMPNLMLYGTGGFAYGQVNHNVSVADITTATVVSGRSVYYNTNTGWTAGGGMEWSPTAFPAWSLKVEYLYTDLGPVHQNMVGILAAPAMPSAPFTASHNSPTRFNTIRAGLNWHFNPFASSAPVLAKY